MNYDELKYDVKKAMEGVKLLSKPYYCKNHPFTDAKPIMALLESRVIETDGWMSYNANMNMTETPPAGLILQQLVECPACGQQYYRSVPIPAVITLELSLEMVKEEAAKNDNMEE